MFQGLEDCNPGYRNQKKLKKMKKMSIFKNVYAFNKFGIVIIGILALATGISAILPLISALQSQHTLVLAATVSAVNIFACLLCSRLLVLLWRKKIELDETNSLITSKEAIN